MSTRLQDRPDLVSLLTGGPYYRALVRARLMNAEFEPARRRAIAFAALTWTPLLLFSLIEGRAFGSPAPGPFIFDIAAHARLLVAVPLLLLAEGLIERNAVQAIRAFVDSSLIRKRDHGVFEAILTRISGIRNSHLPDLVIIGLVVLFGTLFRADAGSPISAWQQGSDGLSLAGWWWVVVSLPVLQFLILRWIWRYLLWSWFLFRMSQLDLRLFPTHPDRAGGLGFLGVVQQSLASIVLALSITLSAAAGQEIYFGYATFADYQFLVLAYAVLVLVVFLAPLFVFTGTLVRLRREGMLAYGKLGQEYVWQFHRKWIARDLPREDTIVGSADIQSLADLNASVDIIRGMSTVPADITTNVLPLLFATFAPFLPWALMLVPIDDLLSFLLGVI
ncbi:MAG: hypothetical protein RLO50_03255 [Azospirillaceae bacterium]